MGRDARSSLAECTKSIVWMLYLVAKIIIRRSSCHTSSSLLPSSAAVLGGPKYLNRNTPARVHVKMPRRRCSKSSIRWLPVTSQEAAAYGNISALDARKNDDKADVQTDQDLGHYMP
jgi:hypothetical protein